MIKETQKQKSWFKTEVDFENSFKWWFALQWQNSYLQIFLACFIITIIGLFKIQWVMDTISENFHDEGFWGGLFSILGFSIPPVVCLVIAYKGFYQYFNDLKNGNSR